MSTSSRVQAGSWQGPRPQGAQASFQGIEPFPFCVSFLPRCLPVGAGPDGWPLAFCSDPRGAAFT